MSITVKLVLFNLDSSVLSDPVPEEGNTGVSSRIESAATSSSPAGDSYQSAATLKGATTVSLQVKRKCLKKVYFNRHHLCTSRRNESTDNICLQTQFGAHAWSFKDIVNQEHIIHIFSQVCYFHLIVCVNICIYIKTLLEAE